jgi:hypothetical protein
VASPVFSERADLVVITAGYPEYHTLAIKGGREGQSGQREDCVAHGEGAIVAVPSPIIDGDWFFIISEGGVAHCFETKTGNSLAGKNGYSMPPSFPQTIRYFLNDNGVMNVVKAGPQFERVAQNDVARRPLRHRRSAMVRCSSGRQASVLH